VQGDFVLLLHLRVSALLVLVDLGEGKENAIGISSNCQNYQLGSSKLCCKDITYETSHQALTKWLLSL
jgi:hypothetical protein